MDDTRMATKLLKVKSKKTVGKTTTEMAGYQEQLLFAAEYKRVEKTSREQGYLEENTAEARLLCHQRRIR
jgi:hypothetical protein